MLWLRGFPLKYAYFPKEELVAEMQKVLLKNWVESMLINVPVLGIRFSISDASVIGSASLTVIAIWLFYTLRRENHAIGQLLHLAKDESQNTKAFVYHGVSATQVFATTSKYDEPLSI